MLLELAHGYWPEIFTRTSQESIKFKWVIHMIVRDSWHTTWAGPFHLPYSNMFGDLRLSQYMQAGRMPTCG